MKSVSVKILLSILTIGILTFAFSNCGPSVTKPLNLNKVSINDKPSQYSKAKALFEFNQPIEICNNPENYQCIYKIFTSHEKSKTLDEELFCLPTNLKVCVLVKTFIISTESAANNSDDDTIYDYNEASCYNKKVKVKEHFIFSGLAETITQAFNQANKSCLKFLEK